MQDPIDQQQEWQDHQYDPGFYTGGKMYPVLENPAKPLLLGIALSIAGAGGLLMFVLIPIALLIGQSEAEGIFILLLSQVVTFLLCAAFLAAGIAMIRRGIKTRREKQQ